MKKTDDQVRLTRISCANGREKMIHESEGLVIEE